MSDLIKVRIASVAFWVGYYWFKIFGFTPKYSYLSLRKLFYTSNSLFNKRLSEKISKSDTPYVFDSTSDNLIPLITKEEVDKIAKSIQRNGYYIFDQRLSDEVIEELKAFSLKTKAKLMPKVSGHNEFDFFDIEKPITIKYEYQESDLITNKNIQKLVTDPGLLSISQAFLGARPILDMISMWWSTTYSKKASSEVAQLYHFDMERIKFLKIFFYLTDVTGDSGPHCYIKGSNNGFPRALQKDGRITDEEIFKQYPKEDILEIAGRRGTILAVDTSGFHKGKNLIEGNRLLLQFEFSNSLFGVKNHYYKVSNPSPRFQDFRNKYPHTFQRYS